MIKPVSGACNLSCKYCFYRDEVEKRRVSYETMSINTLEMIIANICRNCEESFSLSFQGGEPMLAGLDFFKAAVAFSHKYKKNNTGYSFALQTNGTLIDEKWANFFADNRFLIGISLDGTEQIHNRWRGKDTYARVMQGIEYLEKAKVDFNILSVVTSDLAKSVKDVYENYKKSGFRYIQFIPCLNPLGENHNNHKYSLNAYDYASFLCNLFDLWYEDLINGYCTYIHEFCDYIGILNGHPPVFCGHGKSCRMSIVIEADGSVYPCDFYVLDGYKIGNFVEDNAAEIIMKGINSDFIQSSIEPFKNCSECKYFHLCGGGCRRDRFIYSDGNLGGNRFCEAYKTFFDYTIKRFLYLACTIGRES